MSDIFREVDEEYRQEQLLRFWHANAKKLIAVLLLCIAAALGSSYWQTKLIEKKQNETSILAHALVDASIQTKVAARTTFGEAAGKLTGSRLIAATLAEAYSADASGDTPSAIREYDSVVTNKDASLAERQLAEISSIGLQLDTGDPAALEGRLDKLATSDQAWRFTAREFQALLALRQGDKQKAYTIAANLSGETEASDGVHQAAAQIAAISGEGRAAPSPKTEGVSISPSPSSPTVAPAQK